eukprot:CAMPEP_0201865382 /NCGR_PEP_ID=MMETSP0902-20130614/277_1 /ASSEMBLY_ACC=CAM_ASM_000551 /TAXON_ID=420261 /ORGANISM="Thalassiosira antarctica, Strain CCMP982" /LENGTH=55 /DNA_ID=CAMNT_0048390113 /DNA_START=391 /DNA_END=558 /DNA_ORIENTATION=+
MERGIIEAAAICRDDTEKRGGGSPDKGSVKQLHGETQVLLFFVKKHEVMQEVQTK